MSRFLSRAALPILLVIAACYVPGPGYYGPPVAPRQYAAPPSYAPAPHPSYDRRYPEGSYGALGEGYGNQAQTLRKECRSEYGTTVCGFKCEAAYGSVRCAQTPMGACASAYGQVVCWDPEPAVVQTYGFNGRPGQCIAEYGTIACGYGCVAAYGQVRCARTPQDVCQSDYGEIRCTDQ